MVLNPSISENKESTNICDEQISDEVWLNSFKISHKETPQQYRARKESMEKRTIKKETPEERESRIAYMKEKSIKIAQEKADKEQREFEKYLTREERNLQNPTFPKKYKKNPTELDKHLQRMKREEHKEKRQIALEASIERDRERQRRIDSDLANAHYGYVNVGFKFNTGSSRYVSWNVEGN
jgi:hypothetical protein